MSDMIINSAYIVASIMFILGIKMLGKAETAKKGNLLSAVSMLIAIVFTLCDQKILSESDTITWGLIALGIAAGGLIGGVAAKRVQMTQMPEMVALFNGFGGLASLLVAWAEFHFNFVKGEEPMAFTKGAVIATIVIGGITFTGSLYAWGKLSGRISGKAQLFPKQMAMNATILAIMAVAAVLFIITGNFTIGYAMMALAIVFSLVLGITAVMPIGGGDMPVVIALLNSLSGVAASAAGFVIQNNVLVVAGCLVGASGVILTVIMCKAMNRTLQNVLFSGFGSTEESADGDEHGEMKALSVEDAYYVLEAAQSVVFVPGYGMAVAQAQHAVKELGELLEKNGAQVQYAIHPVAGRMPGHMNVLLAEADVEYDQLKEMADVNPIMETVDVVIIIGANDVVNPAAANDKSSPIYGMPIIDAYKAKSVFCLKRGQGAGFSGLVNKLFFMPNSRMIYGDAKATITALVSQFKSGS